jgi:tRNA pseudouridine38-40 synthase
LRYFIQLSYNGTPYHGWQRQPNAVTVQQTIEEALRTILRKPIPIMGAGRTDTGVHAQMMFAHMNVEETAFAKADLENLSYKLNNLLPASIAIQQILPVTEEAHARFDATARSYIYKLSPIKSPFNENTVYYFRPTLDFDKMNEAAQILLDYKDFECFSKARTDVRTYLCSITQAQWKKVGEQWHFTITADRFLRNMVRAIVGTLIEIGREKHPPEWMHEVIKSKDRATAGASAPAHGLYLQTIEYSKELFLD